MAKERASKIDAVLNLYKEKGETPLQTIERYVKRHGEYKGEKMTYAGRLDPMAEGVLLVLAGEEKNRARMMYTALDKDYEFEFICGIETDTFDILGKITSDNDPLNITKSAVEKALAKYRGTFVQKYPPYSSKILDGEPLFEHARQGKLVEANIPTHEVTVRELLLVSTEEISKKDFKKEVVDSIKMIKGDFRQDEILKFWDLFFERLSPKTFVVYKAKVSCESGFYVRQLVSDIGRDLGVGAVTRAIRRTRVGEYKLEDSQK